MGGGPGGTGFGFNVELLVSVACGAMCGVELLSGGDSDACGSGALVGVGVGAVGGVVLSCCDCCWFDGWSGCCWWISER